LSILNLQNAVLSTAGSKLSQLEQATLPTSHLAASDTHVQNNLSAS
jgi:hypothetical protein